MSKTPRRDELIATNDRELAALNALIDSVPLEERDAAFEGSGRDRNLRDIVAHLHAWHLILQDWYVSGTAGGSPAIPAEGYSWEQLDELNEVLRQQWQDTGLEDMRALTATSHAQLQDMLLQFDDEQLFDPAGFAWTGGAPLGEFAHECAGNHYLWADGVIRAGLARAA
ncbi:hypothetical protein ASD65_00720 [Microbacterium sp. Root61]|uniref:ClbS/DfsB family four-helix bundle protein n=1 Tax=Microbacterium sp. Root61 TaxID=1736570 RepID=UPI0006FC5590|nr:ClbS/DfsB family four-helix bundle protein [Microbacterium sp. Root61]KRA23102.1 hypothetical protein ASD65_00720 [Microbacterium sp. Root61]